MTLLLLALRRTAQFAVSVLLTQFLVVLGMVVALDLTVAMGDARLVAAYEAAQKGVDFTAVAQFSSDSDAFFSRLDPVFEQLDFRVVGLLSSSLAFLLLGFLLNRMFKARNRLGWLVIASILLGINPVLAAQGLATRGVQSATLPWIWQGLLVILQVCSLEAGAALSQRMRRHSQTGSA